MYYCAACSILSGPTAMHYFEFLSFQFKSFCLYSYPLHHSTHSLHRSTLTRAFLYNTSEFEADLAYVQKVGINRGVPPAVIAILVLFTSVMIRHFH